MRAEISGGCLLGTVDDEYLTLFDHAQMQMRIGWSWVALNLASVGFLTAILAINPLQKLAPGIVGLVVVAVGYIALMTIISVRTLVNSVRQVERLQAYHVVHSTRDFDGQAD